MRKRKTIVVISGKSGSGKTELALYLQKTMGIPTVVSYTTRAKRENEEDGVQHYFVSEAEMPDKDMMLAYAKFGGYHYWADKRFVDKLDSDIVTYVVNPDAALDMIKGFRSTDIY